MKKLKVYSPTDIQAQVRDAIRAKDGIGKYVTDEEIYETVAQVMVDHMSVEKLVIYTKGRLVAKEVNKPSFKSEAV